MTAPVRLEHAMLMRCTAVSSRPSPKSERTESVYTIALAEIDEHKQGLVGAVTVRDVPHEMARCLSEHLVRGRRYRLIFSLEEVPDRQGKLFDEEQADAEARAEAGVASSISTVTVQAAGEPPITVTGADLARASRRLRAAVREKARRSRDGDRAH